MCLCFLPLLYDNSAALNLGCVPVRASRSQQHANRRSYLSPRTQDTSPLFPKVADSASNERNPRLVPLHSGNQSTFGETKQWFEEGKLQK